MFIPITILHVWVHIYVILYQAPNTFGKTSTDVETTTLFGPVCKGFPDVLICREHIQDVSSMSRPNRMYE